MSTLNAGMYSDPACKFAGLVQDQRRSNPLMTNASWFNDRGEKIGSGDLTIRDLDEVAANMPIGELFIALSEYSSVWNVPSGMSRFNPGIDYVMQNAAWVVSGFDATFDTIYHINSTTGESSGSIKEQDRISYQDVSREKLYLNLGYSSGSFVQPKKSFDTILSRVAFYGLDTYTFPDGKVYAVGGGDAVQEASRGKVRKELFATNLQSLRNFLSFSKEDIRKLESIVDQHGAESNHLLEVILGTHLEDYIEDACVRKSTGSILSNFDGLERYSSDIPGLPPLLYAFRID